MVGGVSYQQQGAPGRDARCKGAGGKPPLWFKDPPDTFTHTCTKRAKQNQMQKGAGDPVRFE